MPGPDWLAETLKGDRDKPRPVLANVLIALRCAPELGGVVLFDVFRNRVVKRKPPPWQPNLAGDEEWSSSDDVHLAAWLQHRGINVSAEIVAQAVDAEARERPFHPVRDHLAGLIWDGKSRLDGWMTKYLGAESTDYVKAIGAKFLISAVARVMSPGCKADNVPVLSGAQGIGKSSALRILGDPFYSDQISQFGTKDAAFELAGVWIIELAELEGMQGTNVAAIKAFISRPSDRFRPPYGRRVVSQPRQCVFVGTVNATDFLRDETGSRRFWPVACSRVDIDGLAGVRDQLWAEARDRYLVGETWWLEDRAVVASAREEQQERYIEDPWHERIAIFAESRETVSQAEILEMLSIEAARQSPHDARRVKKCLRAIGWERYQERHGERRVWRYRRVSPLITE